MPLKIYIAPADAYSVPARPFEIACAPMPRARRDRQARRVQARRRAVLHIAGFAALALAALAGACIGDYIAVRAGPDPYNVAHTRFADCAAFGRLSSHFHHGRCD